MGFSIQMLVMALLLALMGMSTVVMGQRVHSRPVVTTSNAENAPQPQPDLARQASNSTACYDESADAKDVLRPFIPCVPAVSIISQPPTRECCSQLQSKGLTCLCSLFVRYRSRIPPGILSFPRIRELPRQCNVAVPEGTVCDGVPVPSTTPSTQGLESTDTSDAISFGWLTFNP